MSRLLKVRKQIFEMSEKEKEQLVNMCGSIILWESEARSIGYMSDKLNLKPSLIEENIDEMLYVLRKHVGIWRYIKMLFMK